MPNYKIPIYKAEREYGLEESIWANASIAYRVPVEILPEGSTLKRITERVFAAKHTEQGDQLDLHYLRDILATTGWNLNTDIFDRYEVWAARHTPEDKPINFAHRPLEIIGHITASEVVDQDLTPIADDLAVDDLPDKFHLVSGGVLYMALKDEDRKTLMEQTVAEIKEGKWFVSMECFFRGFDYGVIDEEGIQHVIARNEQTAFLTKYMRQYPPKDAEAGKKNPLLGSGTYKDTTGKVYRLGRLMRNITFSGKGLVTDPGNEESIIFNSIAAFNPVETPLGYLNSGTASISIKTTPNVVLEEINKTESNSMPEINEQALRDQIVGQEKTIASLQTELTNLKSKDTESVIAGLRKDVADRDAKITEKDSAVASLTTQVDAFKTSTRDLAARAEKAETELATANKAVAEFKVEKTQAARLAILREKGAEEAVASVLVGKFVGLNDEDFIGTAEALAPSWKKATPKKSGEADLIVKAVTDAKVETEPSLATASENRSETSHAAVTNFLGKSLRSARQGRPSAFADVSETN